MVVANFHKHILNHTANATNNLMLRQVKISLYICCHPVYFIQRDRYGVSFAMRLGIVIKILHKPCYKMVVSVYSIMLNFSNFNTFSIFRYQLITLYC